MDRCGCIWFVNFEIIISMKSLKNIIILIAAVIGFSSCTVTEEISLKKDFSGTYSMKVNMKDMITSLQGFGGDTLLKGMDDGLKDIEKSTTELNAMEGISNSSAIVDKENHVYGMKFDFADIESLNKAKSKDSGGLKALTGESDESHVFFTKKGKKLNYKFPSIKSDQDVGMGAQMLGSSKYQIIFISENKVKKVSNKAYTTSSDGKSTKYEIGVMDLLEGKADPDVNLKF